MRKHKEKSRHKTREVDARMTWILELEDKDYILTKTKTL